MKIQQFADRLEQAHEPSPLLQALQALRACSLEQLGSSRFADWGVWMEDSAQAGQPVPTDPS